MKKYLKKISALLLAFTMIMGMCVTANAATTSNIEVTNLSDSEATTVYIYQLVYWDSTQSKWILTDNATSVLGITQAEFDTDSSVLTSKVQGVTGSFSGTTYKDSSNASDGYITTADSGSGKFGTSVTFEDVEVGAYLIVAIGNETTYSYMIAETYDEDETGMAAENTTVVAKGTGYDVSKDASSGSTYVQRGETVTFTVTTTFPYFTDPDGDETYYIVDTPTGLEIQSVSSVVIGTNDVTTSCNSGYYNSTDFPKVTGATTNDFIIDLSNLIGIENTNAGLTVVITYTAVVTSTEGYKNTANAYKDGVSIGDGETGGYSGGIKITKYAGSSTTTLAGAEFSVYKLKTTVANSAAAKTASDGELMYFVYVSDGVYEVALSSTETGVTSTIIAGTDGTVTIIGLEADYYYHFAETKAPDGYSINENGVTVQVTEDDAQAYSGSSKTLKEGSLSDTKLSALPSTGGLGTYLFTIIGVVVMAVMASLYFIKRRRDSAE